MGNSSKSRQIKKEGTVNNFYQTTEIVGTLVRPSIEFDDWDFIKDLQKFRLSEVKIWHTDKNIVGLQTFYEIDENIKTTSSHEGTHYSQIKCTSLKLIKNEYLNEIQIGGIEHIKSLNLFTNKKNSLILGDGDQEVISFVAPENCCFVSFAGSTCEYLNTLKANYIQTK
jgi:hypothetical protein